MKKLSILLFILSCSFIYSTDFKTSFIENLNKFTLIEKKLSYDLSNATDEIMIDKAMSLFAKEIIPVTDNLSTILKENSSFFESDIDDKLFVKNINNIFDDLEKEFEVIKNTMIRKSSIVKSTQTKKKWDEILVILNDLLSD